MGRPKLDKPDFVTKSCLGCKEDLKIRYYDQKRHSGFCKACGVKNGAIARTEKDRDSVFLKKTLRNMKARCNGKYDNYNKYTEKGISVCDEWIENPMMFVV